MWVCLVCSLQLLSIDDSEYLHVFVHAHVPAHASIRASRRPEGAYIGLRDRS